jgi:choline dehydrogenase
MSLREHDWGFTAEAVPGRVIPYPRGRVVGGSSAVNAAIELRGVPADYDEWALLGNAGWSWKNVLPYFRRLEDDPAGAAEVHGRRGPIPIRRWREDELIPTQRAFLEVCRRLGFPEVADHNHPDATGVGSFPQNRRGRLRISTAIAYLLPARVRPNLTIRPSSLVHRVLINNRRAVGLEVESGGEPARVYGRRLTLAAGAIGSPAILMRSGIGPAGALVDLGIEPAVDLPGVGASLSDHPVTRVLLVPRAGSCELETPLAQVVLRYTAPGSDEFNDMQQVVFSHVDIPSIGGQRAVAAVGTPLAIGLPVALERPHARGHLSLASLDPRVQPRIDLNYASDPHDLRRLVAGVRLAWRIANEPEIAKHVDRVALLSEDTPGLGRGDRGVRPRNRHDSVSPLRHRADGTGERSHGSGRPARPGPRHREPARRRCLDHANHPAGEHQPHLHHDRRARGRLDPSRGISTRPRYHVSVICRGYRSALRRGFCS